MNRCVYLNNGATSYPKPDSVVRGVAEFLNKPPFHHARTGFESVSEDVIFGCRRNLATLFNAPDASRIIFSSGATESLNLVLIGLSLRGKHVVTTAVEHNSVLRPLKTMERNGDITLTIVGCDDNGYVPPERIADALIAKTGAVVVNHCSNVTGVVNDIASIGEIARQENIPFIVDASQSAGVYPINIQAMNIDVLVFAGHKSLYGIQGIGGAYIREGLSVKPLKVGGTGVRSDYLFQPEKIPMLYEAGTQNMPGIVALCRGVRYILEVGMDVMRERKEALVERMRDYLSEWDTVRLYPGKNYTTRTTLFCFTVKETDPGDIGYLLENNYGIVIRSGLHCAPLIHQYIGTFPEGSVRVSPSYFTTDEDVSVFNEAVGHIARMAV